MESLYFFINFDEPTNEKSHFQKLTIPDKKGGDQSWATLLIATDAKYLRPGRNEHRQEAIKMDGHSGWFFWDTPKEEAEKNVYDAAHA